MNPHPRSLIRSCLLWLALPGLLFLLWGWLNDPAYYNGTSFSVGDHYLAISDNGRQVYLSASRYSPGSWTAPGFRSLRAPRTSVNLPEDEQTLFSDAFVCGIKRPSHGSTTIWVNLAYWLLILLYLAALLPACLWWQRRKARLITPAAPPHNTLG